MAIQYECPYPIHTRLVDSNRVINCSRTIPIALERACASVRFETKNSLASKELLPPALINGEAILAKEGPIAI